MKTLQEWLDHQLALHPKSIEFGLERVGRVWRAMGAPRPAPIVITVGGTNGKGSSVAMLDAILRAAGYRVGTYTSPHILRYNERVTIQGQSASDAELIASFERIEHHRGAVSLTFFECGTLAALDVLARNALDVAILEVGMGGRLDAVNLIDADAALITTVDLDHQAFLGTSREAIGLEKAGIARAHRPLILGEAEPPQSVLHHAASVDADVWQASRAFSHQRLDDAQWQWHSADGESHVLPLPVLQAPIQLRNAASVVAVLHALRERMPVARMAIAHGLRATQLRGRLQIIQHNPLVIVDVGHNPQAARALLDWLQDHPHPGPSVAVFGALEDKDVAATTAVLMDQFDQWWLCGLDRRSTRGLSAAALQERSGAAMGNRLARVFDDPDAAWPALQDAMEPSARVLVFGSFLMVEAALRHFNPH